MEIKKWALYGSIGVCGVLCAASSAGVLTMLSVGSIASYFANSFLSFGGLLLLGGLALIVYRYFRKHPLINNESKSEFSEAENNEKCCS